MKVRKPVTRETLHELAVNAVANPDTAELEEALLDLYLAGAVDTADRIDLEISLRQHPTNVQANINEAEAAAIMGILRNFMSYEELAAAARAHKAKMQSEKEKEERNHEGLQDRRTGAVDEGARSRP